jgi:hypothetical protein
MKFYSTLSAVFWSRDSSALALQPGVGVAIPLGASGLICLARDVMGLLRT